MPIQENRQSITERLSRELREEMERALNTPPIARSTITERDFEDLVNTVTSRPTITTTASDTNYRWLNNEPTATVNYDLRDDYSTFVDPHSSSEEIADFDEKIIILKNGKKAKKEECVYIEGNWYKKNDKSLVVDCITKILTHKDYCESVVSSLEFINGAFKETKELTNHRNIQWLPVVNSFKYGYHSRIASVECIKNWEFKEDLNTGQLVDLEHPDTPLNKITFYETYKNYFSRCVDNQKLIKIGAKSPSYTITEGLRYSFGIELEASRGFLPMWKAFDKYNLLCVRDGSLNGGSGGPEYVTGILTGDTGFKHLQEICLELSKKTLINSSCGVHLHIGNVNFSKQFLVNSYRLALILEDEIFSTLPKSRRDNGYCKKLRQFNFRPALNKLGSEIELEEDYNKLFKYISVEKANNPTFDYNKSKQHPMGAKCGYNHDTPRYCWLNYVPAMFNTRDNGSYSLEVRSHNGSTNFTKIKNWTLLFFAFVAFTERFPEEIVEGITIETILNRIFPKKAKSLIRYFQLRKELFKNVNSETEEYKQEEQDVFTIKDLITY